jgi:hypothetical protein
MRSSVEIAERWVDDLYRGDGLRAWQLTHEPQRVELVQAWRDWATDSGARAVALMLGTESARDALVTQPEAVEPSPEVWRSLRDFTRMIWREFAPGINDAGWAFVATAEPVGVDREIARYIRVPPARTSDAPVVVDSIAIELLLVDGRWQVVGPRPCAAFLRRIEALSSVH